MNAFYELSENPDCQVLISTHTPNIARMVPIECLRYIAVCGDDSRDILCGSDNTCELLASDLGVLADHDVKLFAAVEGVNDINFLKGMSRILNENNEDVPDLTQLENDGKIIFIPCGGTNLAYWVSRLANLNRPEFHLFDRDTEPPEVSKNQAVVDEINNRDGCKAVLTGKKEMENYCLTPALYHSNIGKASCYNPPLFFLSSRSTSI